MSDEDRGDAEPTDRQVNQAWLAWSAAALEGGQTGISAMRKALVAASLAERPAPTDQETARAKAEAWVEYRGSLPFHIAAPPSIFSSGWEAHAKFVAVAGREAQDSHS